MLHYYPFLYSRHGCRCCKPRPETVAAVVCRVRSPFRRWDKWPIYFRARDMIIGFFNGDIIFSGQAVLLMVIAIAFMFRPNIGGASELLFILSIVLCWKLIIFGIWTLYSSGYCRIRQVPRNVHQFFSALDQRVTTGFEAKANKVFDWLHNLAKNVR